MRKNKEEKRIVYAIKCLILKKTLIWCKVNFLLITDQDFSIKGSHSHHSGRLLTISSPTSS